MLDLFWRVYIPAFLLILLGFDLDSSPGFTLIFIQILTWRYVQFLSSPPDLGITGSCSEYFLVVSNWLGWSDGGLASFHRRSDGIIVDNVDI